MRKRDVVRRLLQRLVRIWPAGYRGSRGAGQQWERLAARRLRSAGYVVRERNFRGRRGEIDLVAEEKGVLCFVEVKGRTGPGFGFGSPAESVTAEKQRRLARVAEEYLVRRRLPSATRCRFDVVAISESGSETQVEILRDAFVRPDERAPRR